MADIPRLQPIDTRAELDSLRKGLADLKAITDQMAALAEKMKGPTA